MKSFERFLALLARIPDPRRAEGKLYRLPYILLFSILAIVSGANSYRGIRTFIKVHRQKLNTIFKINWKRAPAHTAIRYILQGLKAGDVEKTFREHAAGLNRDACGSGARVLALDGKTLRGSFDNFNDTKAKQVLSAFAVDTALVLAHVEIDEKSNEIPAAQTLLRRAPIEGMLVTADALHTQTETARIIVQERGADYLMTVKGNQPTVAESVRQLQAGLRRAFSPSA